MLASCHDAVLDTIRSSAKFRRDDYKEFADLCRAFLNDEEYNDGMLIHPGAIHKARWMGKLLYAIKICLLEQQILELPRGTVTTQQQVAKVRDFVVFITHVYSTWWLSCESSTNAPWLDLNLYKLLMRYKAVNKTISESAVRAFARHTWYLTAERVILALFDKVVPADERRALADALLAVKPEDVLLAPKNRFGTGFGKPRFPDINQASRSRRRGLMVHHLSAQF